MSDERLASWAADQRALAKALGLTIEEWMRELEAAGTRKTGLTAAVVGAAMKHGLGLGVLDGLDGEALAARARALIDPRPPRVENPLLAEAIRRSEDLSSGAGARRLKKKPERAEIPRPTRETRPLGPSSDEATSDAPGQIEDDS